LIDRLGILNQSGAAKAAPLLFCSHDARGDVITTREPERFAQHAAR
jgi:hypothetical protein